MTIYAPANAKPGAPIHKMGADPLTILCNPRSTIDSVVCTDEPSRVTCGNCKHRTRVSRTSAPPKPQPKPRPQPRG